MKTLYAGAQGSEQFLSLENISKASGKKLNLLMSYFYLRKKSDKAMLELMARMHEMSDFVLLDSGAHSFFSMTGDSSFHEMRAHIGNQATNMKSEDPHAYFAAYLEWLDRWGEHFDVIVELDIDMIVGLPQVLEWRETMKERGITPCPVLHRSYDKSYLGELARENRQWSEAWRAGILEREFEKMCEEYDYVGLEGGMKPDAYIDLLRISDRHKTKVHGFAMTNKEVFKNTTFYSVDSTSWLTGSQFGVTFLLKGNDMKVYGPDKKAVRNDQRDFCAKYNVDWDMFMNDKSLAVNQFNAAQWLEYQDVLDMLHRNDATVVASGESIELVKVPIPVDRELEQLRIGRWCDRCYLANSCPYYEKANACSVPFALTPKEVAKNMKMAEDPMKEMCGDLLRESYERVKFFLAAERVKGGLPDPEVSKAISAFMKFSKEYQELVAPRDSVTITATAKGPGAISKMFGGYGKRGQAKPSQVLEEPDTGWISHDTKPPVDFINLDKGDYAYVEADNISNNDGAQRKESSLSDGKGVGRKDVRSGIQEQGD